MITSELELYVIRNDYNEYMRVNESDQIRWVEYHDATWFEEDEVEWYNEGRFEVAPLI